ncbi:MAG: hypothetical protein WDN76_06045 [Alphaproteobacteria bacterium]
MFSPSTAAIAAPQNIGAVGLVEIGGVIRPALQHDHLRIGGLYPIFLPPQHFGAQIGRFNAGVLLQQIEHVIKLAKIKQRLASTIRRSAATLVGMPG